MSNASLIIASGLAVFWGVSLLNVIKHRGTRVRNENETPMSTGFLLALTGSLLLFAESLAFIGLDYSGVVFNVGVVQGVGLVVFLGGCLLHAWSVVVRGRFSTSWSMHDDHQLIIDAPYSIVRHPSYLGYVLMILGMSLVWTQWYTFLSWIAVPDTYWSHEKRRNYS